MAKESESIEISGGYSKKEPESFRDVVLRAIEKIRIEGSKEMTKGGEITQIIDGDPVVITIPNQRNIYIQSINTFYDLLVNFFDEEFKKNTKDYIEGIETDKTYKDIFQQYLKEELDPYLKQEAKRTQLISEESEFREMAFKSMDDLKMIYHRKIFQELILLFQRKKELSRRKIIDIT